jgi:predicted dehydrogenase
MGLTWGNGLCETYKELLSIPEIDIVIVATPVDFLAEITIAALHSGKHVLVEKPAARNVAEIDAMIAAEKESGKHVRVGFNLRYHRVFRTAWKLREEIGKVLFVRAKYGHGGRTGYEKDWRMLDSRGEMIDQGVHLIDLSSCFLGEFTKVQGVGKSYYWNQSTIDNCFLTLETKDGKVAFLQASCTEWKNQFQFEIIGTNGKIEIDGLGGSYGVEEVTLFKKIEEGEPPAITTWVYAMPDDSLEREIESFIYDIEQVNQNPEYKLQEARRTLVIVSKIK